MSRPGATGGRSIEGGVLLNRGAGALAAVISAVSYDFFLTKPYLSLNIDSADDV